MLRTPGLSPGVCCLLLVTKVTMLPFPPAIQKKPSALNCSTCHHFGHYHQETATVAMGLARGIMLVANAVTLVTSHLPNSLLEIRRSISWSADGASHRQPPQPCMVAQGWRGWHQSKNQMWNEIVPSRQRLAAKTRHCALGGLGGCKRRSGCGQLSGETIW
jgi:hypothetical protein